MLAFSDVTETSEFVSSTRQVCAYNSAAANTMAGTASAAEVRVRMLSSWVDSVIHSIERKRYRRNREFHTNEERD